MWKKSKTNEIEKDFKHYIPEYNDEEILEILKKRKYYQAEAVELALDEAYKRELIHSEQDLFDEEFRTEPLRFRIFPNIEDDKNKNKIRKSIARGTLITGVIPTIWGFLTLNAGNSFEGALLVLFGIFWIFLSARLIQNFNRLIINSLLYISGLSVVYVVYLLLPFKTIVFMDVFIVLALYGFLTYGLLFLKKMK